MRLSLTLNIAASQQRQCDWAIFNYYARIAKCFEIDFWIRFSGQLPTDRPTPFGARSDRHSFVHSITQLLGPSKAPLIRPQFHKASSHDHRRSLAKVPATTKELLLIVPPKLIEIWYGHILYLSIKQRVELEPQKVSSIISSPMARPEERM